MYRFRKVSQSDRDRVLEISSKIWDGEDFIEQVFDEWVRDTEGEFTLGEKDGNIVGFAKYTRLNDQEIWLEGIRVDEKYANQGFGKAITQYYLSRAKSEGAEVVRLSIHLDSRESIKIVEGLGFKKDGYFTMGWKLMDKAQTAIQTSNNVINIMSTATAWDLITRGNAYYMSNGYIGFGWSFLKATYELVDKLVKEKRVYGMLREGKMSSVMILTEDSHEDGGLSIGFIDGDMAPMRELVQFAEQQALKLGMKYCEIMAPMDERLINVLELCGYQFLSEKYREVNVFVYSRKLIE